MGDRRAWSEEVANLFNFIFWIRKIIIDIDINE